MNSCKRLSVGQRLLVVCAIMSFQGAGEAADSGVVSKPTTQFTSRANSLPRKVVIASAVAHFSGSLQQRLALAQQLIDQAALEAKQGHQHRGLDLVVLPEFAFCEESGKTAAERAVELKGPVFDRLSDKAREHRTWIVAPMTLLESERDRQVSNAAVLLDRNGHVAGIFRKVHPMLDADGTFEGGVTPGQAYPIFNCDFGRLGILICWDMGYEDAWEALAVAGAEIIAMPSASPQTLRPGAEAMRHHVYVVTSAPRDNASLFDPIGRQVATATRAPGILVHEIDLAYAILHWSETLQEGRALRERFGSRVGYDYSSREDTGVFWSNDPQLAIGTMVQELGLTEMPAEIERIDRARKSVALGSRGSP